MFVTNSLALGAGFSSRRAGARPRWPLSREGEPELRPEGDELEDELPERGSLGSLGGLLLLLEDIYILIFELTIDLTLMGHLA